MSNRPHPHNHNARTLTPHTHTHTHCPRDSLSSGLIQDPGSLCTKRDRKVINVDPMENPGDNSRRVEVPTHEYMQVVLWDHVTRRKN